MNWIWIGFVVICGEYQESEESSSTDDKSVSHQPVEGLETNHEVGSGDLPPTESIIPPDLNYSDKSTPEEVEVKG